MTTNEQIEKQASHIADAIVDLVERCDGPVMLAQINREIPGFGTNEDPSWDYHIKHEGGVSIIWDGMTEAGTKALRKVIRGRRVAVQLVDARLYILEGYSIRNERCVPIVLLPARAANLETPAFPLLRIAREQEWMMQATDEKELETGSLDLVLPVQRQIASLRCDADQKVEGGNRYVVDR